MKDVGVAEIFGSKFGPICISKLSFTKDSNLILFFFLNVSLETAFRVESEIGFACLLAKIKSMIPRFYYSKLQKNLKWTNLTIKWPSVSVMALIGT